MTIMYCSWATGDDLTGDGSSGNPYKKINKASEGLTGGDEVRVEKSPDPTSLPGTVAWVDGTNHLTTSQDLTGILVPGDFIKKDLGTGETWWEVEGLDVAAVHLYRNYSGDTVTMASLHLGVTDTGSAGGTNTIVQEIKSSGLSANPLRVTGGWDLTTEIQDGETFFRQTHPTYSNRWGHGIRLSTKLFVDIEKIHILRYRYGFNSYSCSTINFIGCHGIGNYYNYYIYYANGVVLNQPWACGGGYGIYCYQSQLKMDKPICLSNTPSGIYLYSSYGSTFNSPVCRRNTTYNIYAYRSPGNLFTNVDCRFGAYGVYFYYSFGNQVEGITVIGTTSRAIYFSYAYNEVLSDVTLEDNYYAIYSRRSSMNTFYNVSFVNNIHDVYLYDKTYTHLPTVTIYRYENEKADRWIFDTGYVKTDQSDGFTLTGNAIKFCPNSTTKYVYHSWFCRACKNLQRNVSIYMGAMGLPGADVQASLYFMGRQIVDWQDWIMGATYEKFELIAEAADITENEILELRIRAVGPSSEYAWADNFSEYTSEDLMAEMLAHRESTEDKIGRILVATEIRQVTVNDPAASVTEFITDLTENMGGFWDRGAIVFTSGENKGVMRKMQFYDAIEHKIKVRTALPFVPADGDTLIIVPARAFRLNHADINELVDDVYDEARADHDDVDSFGEGFNDAIDAAPIIQAKTDLLTFDNDDNVHSVPKDLGVLETEFNEIDDELGAPEYGLHALMTLLLAIDNSGESEARFDEIKGIDWTDETLKAIKDAIDGGAGRDWSDAELSDIRGALGVEGTKTTPNNGQLQDIKDATDLIGGVRAKTDLLEFSGDNDVMATLAGERVNLADPTEEKLDNILSDTSEIEAVKVQTDKMQFNAGNDIKATIDGEQVVVDPVIPLTLELLKKMGTNRLELSPGITDNWILYDDNDIDPLLTFSVRDKSGFAIQLADGAPARRSKGT